jgi:thiosulfate reductase cytochrome b subunit
VATAPGMIGDATAKTDRPAGGWIFRHRASTRIWHWTNTVLLLVMLMSGLMIFNAHPRLYWGEYGANTDTPWLWIGSTPQGGGHVLIGSSIDIQTGGVLGRSTNKDGGVSTHAFPWWATIPSGYSLAAARRWHLSFAWLFVLTTIAYALVSLVNGHLRRDLMPKRRELSPRHLWRDIVDHLKLRFHDGEPGQYNILQKLTYGLVLFILLPGVILTGMTMSPAFDAAFPWLLDLFGGRQSARSIHFICTAGFVGFIVVHLILVMLAGPLNEIRSMITGWFHIHKIKGHGIKGRETRGEQA